MPYAQIEVSAPRHHKLSGTSDGAFRLWVTGLCYCQEHLTDGVIHADVLPSLMRGRVRRALVKELVSRALWDELADGKGWVVHDYLTWNDGRDRVLERRANLRARQEKWRAARAGGKPTNNALVTVPHRNASQRSTDQDQEHRPDGRTRQLRLERQQAHKDPGPPDFKRLCVIAAELFDVVGFTEPSADASEALKARCARLGIAYDSDHVWSALEAQAAARRKRA